jgi:hypothetical protein
LWLCAGSRPAYSWDSRTHELITRLAISALPASPLKTSFESSEGQLEDYSIAPDTVLRQMYGKAEGRRHYIDLEYFGADPFANLNPDLSAMERKYGDRTLDSSGTLPWTIEAEAAAMTSALQAGNCPGVLQHAGYLSHYVGDSSQPLHTTKFYDGPAQSDRGMHERLESSVDHRVDEIGKLAASQVHYQPINSVWPAVIAQLKESNALVGQVVAADRAARSGADSEAAYTRALMRIEQDMIVRQVAGAASLLASIWDYEDRLAGAPAVCR